MTMSKALKEKCRRKEVFIENLAAFLSKDLARRSIQLQMRDPHALDWASLWSTAGLFGYPSKEEVEECLTELLE